MQSTLGNSHTNRETFSITNSENNIQLKVYLDGETKCKTTWVKPLFRNRIPRSRHNSGRCPKDTSDQKESKLQNLPDMEPEHLRLNKFYNLGKF